MGREVGIDRWMDGWVVGCMDGGTCVYSRVAHVPGNPNGGGGKPCPPMGGGAP